MSTEVQVHQPFTRCNIGRMVKVKLTEGDGLTITSRQKVKNRVVQVIFPLDRLELTNNLCLALEVFEKNPTHTSMPGALWSSVDISLGYQGEKSILDLVFEVRWNVSLFVSQKGHTDLQRNLRNRILNTFFPDVYQQVVSEQADCQESRSPQDFYEAAFVPDRDSESEVERLHVPRLTADLYPFQQRAVRWLLGREGVQWTSRAVDDGPGVIQVPPADNNNLGHFIQTTDAEGETCFISDLFGIVTKDISPFQKQEAALRGGILAEEMGLGKTLEIISLILLHSRSPQPPLVYDSYLGVQVRPTPATLIVTPPSLRHQWVSELRCHAPQLRVMVYPGIGKKCKDSASELELVESLASQDVVITTYNELKTELHFALDPPERAIRGERKHHRPKSPLVQLSWWRVCLDEAQEVESGISNAATLARIIPRVNAWGVTGTPVKDGVQGETGCPQLALSEPANSWEICGAFSCFSALNRTRRSPRCGSISPRATRMCFGASSKKSRSATQSDLFGTNSVYRPRNATSLPCLSQLSKNSTTRHTSSDWLQTAD